MKHEQRVVQHVTGRKEALDACVCGNVWPCILAYGAPVPPYRKLRLHVRTVWSEWHGKYHVFYCLSGISLRRPNLRTTWDTNISNVYYVAKRVANNMHVSESYGLYRLVGQVTTDPL